MSPFSKSESFAKCFIHSRHTISGFNMDGLNGRKEEPKEGGRGELLATFLCDCFFLNTLVPHMTPATHPHSHTLDLSNFLYTNLQYPILHPPSSIIPAHSDYSLYLTKTSNPLVLMLFSCPYTPRASSPYQACIPVTSLHSLMCT